MRQLIFQSDGNWLGLILRLTLGLVLFPHGAQKTLSWFGGSGYAGTMKVFTEDMHLPWIIALLVIFIEFAGSLCLIAGFAVRLWSVGIIILFLGMIFMVHGKIGFFMNWYGNQTGEGFEYHLLVIGLALAILLNGSGKLSLDQYLNSAGS